MPSIKLTPTQSLLIQLAQKERARNVAEAQALVDKANVMLQQADGGLRAAVERAMRDSLSTIPDAKVEILNDEAGAPALLSWDDVAEPKPGPTALPQASPRRKKDRR